MSEQNIPKKEPASNSNQDSSIEEMASESIKAGPTSLILSAKGIAHNNLDPDHFQIETIAITPEELIITTKTLKENGFDYLQCQGGYDEGPGKKLVSFYHFIAMGELIENDCLNVRKKLREVRIKVFLPRSGKPTLPSIYEYFKGSDWQERETFDMYGIYFEGHPHPKRLLMPEDWVGWPLRKDYVQPDFYEMQDAY